MTPLSDNYTIVKEFRTEFDPEQFNEKIVQVLLKYDFLVGDFADDQLRLKGFYHNKRRNIEANKRAAIIEKYITESCNYMCPHYVLEKIQDRPDYKKTSDKYYNSRKHPRNEQPQ